MIITVAGPHGTGKTTYAAHLAKELGLRHVSAGALFRRAAKEKGITIVELGPLALKDPSIDRLIDQKTMEEAEKGEVVIDGQLAGWVLKEVAQLRIYLTAPEKIRLERIAKRDNVSLEEARKQTLDREKIQKERYRVHYGFNVEDLSIYHLVLDTSIAPIKGIEQILSTAAKEAKNSPPRKQHQQQKHSEL